MEPRKIVLVGKTGDGKSSAGNTILRKKVFTPKASANSVTAKSVGRDGLVRGRKITVIDTPGFFDTDCDDKEIKSDIIKSLIECAPAVHAFVMVLKVGRYTRQENEVVQQFLNTFKEELVLKHTVILFTHGAQLEGQTIEEFVKTNSKLQELVNKCGGCCHVIDNKYWNDCDSGNKSNKVQVKNLLDAIDKMVKENGCYTNELLQKVEEEIQLEMEKNEDNLPQEEKREKAKKIVQKILVQVAGTATGMVFGAVMGVGVALSSVLTLLNAFCPLNDLLKAKAAAVVGGGAAVEAAVGGGAAAAAVETGAAAGGAGAAAGGGIAAGVLGVAAFVGAVGGGVIGWEAAEDAESMSDAMKKAAEVMKKNAKVMVEKVEEFAAVALQKKKLE